MKFIRIMHSYFNRMRISSVILSLMMTVSIFMGIITFSHIQYIAEDYSILSSITLTDAYYYQSVYDPATFFDNGTEDHNSVMAALVESLKNEPAIETVYTIKAALPVSCNDSNIGSIILYDPGMPEVFPMLKKSGIDFSSDPDGCILIGDTFKSEKGSTIELVFYRPKQHNESFSVSDVLSAPCKCITFSVSGTKLSSGDFFATGDAIIMQSTDAVIERLDDIAEISYSDNFIFSFKSGADQNEIDKVLNMLDKNGRATSIDEILMHSKNEVLDEVRRVLPRPAFLLLASTVAYLSTTILMFKKKEKELSVYYLCGACKRKCILVIMGAGCTISLVPSRASEMLHNTYPMDKPYFGGLFLYAIKTNDHAARYDSEKEAFLNTSQGATVAIKLGKRRTIRLYASLFEIYL